MRMLARLGPLLLAGLIALGMGGAVDMAAAEEEPPVSEAARKASIKKLGKTLRKRTAARAASATGTRSWRSSTASRSSGAGRRAKPP